MSEKNKLIPGLPSGFEDRWNKKLILKKRLLKVIEKNFSRYGFDPLETPSFEISENIGSFLAEDDSNPMSDVFTFNDGDKNITLRYDLSSPLARFVAQNNQELPSIYKRYAIQNVFRNEKAGNARYREFTQADCDIVGNVNPAQANAELCNLITDTLLDCGLKKDQFIINVSNRKIVQGLIENLKIPDEKQIKVMRAIDKLDKPGFGLKGVEELLKKERKDKSGAITKGADLSDDQAAQILNFLKIKDLNELKQISKNQLIQDGIKELEQLFEVLNYGSNAAQVKANFTIVRGLAYYDGFCVETNLNFKAKNNKNKEQKKSDRRRYKKYVIMTVKRKSVSLKIGKHKSRSGGLTAAGRKKYNAATGSNLKAPQPQGGPRKKSFCARMGGVKGPMKDSKGRPTRKALALRKWKC